MFVSHFVICDIFTEKRNSPFKPIKLKTDYRIKVIIEKGKKDERKNNKRN